MKIVRVLTALVALAAVSACATPFQVAQVQDVIAAPSPTVGTPFTKALTEEYQEATRHEALDESEWRHAAIFADKAERAATGEAVPPEDPADWDLPAPVMPVLRQARTDLMDDFAKGARERVPTEAARAQVSLDCWMEEEWEREGDSVCKENFLDTEPKLKPPPPPVVTEVEPPAPPPQPLVIPFDYNRSDINASAMQLLYAAAPALKAAKPLVIHIDGFTDTVGGKPYNQALSERRAQAVAAQLKALGVEGVTVKVMGYGKEKLAVHTKNNVREQRNRRAEVTWETAP